MKIGDLVTDDFNPTTAQDLGIVISSPRLTTTLDYAALGVMDGDLYEVVDVLCPDGEVRLFIANELRVVNESR